MKSVSWVSAILIGVIVAVLIARTLIPHTPADTPLQLTFTEEEMSNRIEQIGAADTYAEFKVVLQDAPGTIQHEYAHRFGHALYEHAGIEGLNICDDSFAYGCAHELVSNVLVQEGLDKVSVLFDTCNSSLFAGNCNHGLGHGLVGALGYDVDSLETSLLICEENDENGSANGCYAGVHMEYNLYTMLDNDEVRTKPNGNWYAPCDNLDSRFKEACYYGQPQWWSSLMYQAQGSSDPKIFPSMAALCEELPPNESFACLAGVGMVAAAIDNGNPIAIQDVCNNISARADSKLLCMSYAASILTVTGFPSDAIIVCDSLTKENNQYCMAHANGEGSINHRIPLPLL